MKRIKSYEELSRAVSGYLRPGVAANVMVTREKFEPDIQAGRLFLRAGESNLWIASRREHHVRLYFYLNDPAQPPEEDLDLPAVAEIAFRGDGGKLAALESCPALRGFRTAFRRIRLSRSPEPRPAGGGISACRPSDAKAVCRFLEANFPPLTGCLLTLDEVLTEAADKRFLVLEDEKGIAGLIHMAPEKNGVEIRHLAVREDRRGQGLAGGLVSACVEENPGRICRVWVREDYGGARQVYAKAGFRPDGWRSLVLQSQ